MSKSTHGPTSQEYCTLPQNRLTVERSAIVNEVGQQRPRGAQVGFLREGRETYRRHSWPRLFSSSSGCRGQKCPRQFPKKGVKVGIEQGKQIEFTPDLTVIPLEKSECCHIIENEGRSEDNIHARD